MNSRQIEYILEVARTRNFNRAAEDLYVSQPTVSYQINAAEEEIGFRIFDRSGKGAELTPAGAQFVATLREIEAQYKRAVEQGQNFSTRYRDDIRIGMSVRSALYYLPEIIDRFQQEEPSVSVTPQFNYHHALESFLQGEQDILFSVYESVKQIPDITLHPLFDSRLCLVCRPDDPLAKKTLIKEEDLFGRTLMIGGGSPAPLRALQQRLIRHSEISYFNSNDHDTSLTFVAAGKAVVITPDFLNDHHPQFRWIPFDCEEKIPCVLCTHSSDERKTLKEFTERICRYYRDYQAGNVIMGL